MLPGIGVIGLSENPKRGINISSTVMWWTPGLLNILAVSPGWENAPLNGYLTNDLLNKINMVITRLTAEDKILLSPNQFYRNSDFSLDDPDVPTSDERLRFFQARNDEKRANRVEYIKSLRAIRKSKGKVTIEVYQDRIKFLEDKLGIESIDIDAEVERRMNDPLQNSYDRKL